MPSFKVGRIKKWEENFLYLLTLLIKSEVTLNRIENANNIAVYVGAMLKNTIGRL
jgi:hypothetical protein